MEIMDVNQLESVLWWVFTPSIILFLFMVLGSLLGFGDGDADLDFDADVEADVDFDADGDDSVDSQGFPVFTIKNLFAFLSMFSASTLMFIGYEFSQGLSIVLGGVCGVVFVLLLTSLFFYISKLKNENIPKLQNAIGKEGTVYLEIPANGVGQVTVPINGALQTVEASGKDDKGIGRGKKIKVVSSTPTLVVVDEVSA